MIDATWTNIQTICCQNPSQQSGQLRNDHTRSTHGKRTCQTSTASEWLCGMGTQHPEAYTSPPATKYQRLGSVTTLATSDWITIRSGPVRKTH